MVPAYRDLIVYREKYSSNNENTFETDSLVFSTFIFLRGLDTIFS